MSHKDASKSFYGVTYLQLLIASGQKYRLIIS